MNTEPPYSARILVIDDQTFYLELLNDVLSPDYQISLARNARQGLKRAQGRARPDLILLDIVMPEMDGYDTCRELKRNPLTRDIPVIFLTARQDTDDELRGFEVGAIDYITKPFSVPVVQSRIRSQLALARQRDALEHLVAERTEEIERTKDAIVHSMAELAEARDEETGEHLIRTSAYVKALASKLSQQAEYRHILTPRVIHAYQRAAPLHDIGKVGIPDRILQKKGPLDDEERAIIEQHPLLGYTAIENAEKRIGSTLFIQVAKEITYCHHEKWDGSGYPRGIAGESIPLSARLLALSDVYDALISERYYKRAMPHEQAVEWIASQKGLHFDPLVVDCFSEIQSEFRDIAAAYGNQSLKKQ
jgi:putative two-component system response regulator